MELVDDFTVQLSRIDVTVIYENSMLRRGDMEMESAYDEFQPFLSGQMLQFAFGRHFLVDPLNFACDELFRRFSDFLDLQESAFDFNGRRLQFLVRWLQISERLETLKK